MQSAKKRTGTNYSFYVLACLDISIILVCFYAARSCFSNPIAPPIISYMETMRFNLILVFLCLIKTCTIFFFYSLVPTSFRWNIFNVNIKFHLVCSAFPFGNTGAILCMLYMYINTNFPNGKFLGKSNYTMNGYVWVIELKVEPTSELGTSPALFTYISPARQMYCRQKCDLPPLPTLLSP